MWCAHTSCEGRMLGQWLGTLTPIPEMGQNPEVGSGARGAEVKCELYPQESRYHFTPLGLSSHYEMVSQGSVVGSTQHRVPSGLSAARFHPCLLLPFFPSHHTPLPDTTRVLPAVSHTPAVSSYRDECCHFQVKVSLNSASPSPGGLQ